MVGCHNVVVPKKCTVFASRMGVNWPRRRAPSHDSRVLVNVQLLKYKDKYRKSALVHFVIIAIVTAAA